MTPKLPYVEIAPNTYELDEFDCGSVFVLVGEEKAMVIDTGTGVGDLYGTIREITDKPLVLVLTHAHMDHVGAVGWFDEYYMSKEDVGKYGEFSNMEGRKGYAGFIAARSGKKYPYDPDVDIRPWPENANPKFIPLFEGQAFDLGGRIVTAMACPGHTPGSMVFIDSATRILFAGDACNCNILYGSLPGDPRFISVEKSGEAMKAVYALRGKLWDKCYNGHHDFREFGEPLDDEVMPFAIELCENLVSGNYEVKTVPGMFPGSPDRTVVTKPLSSGKYEVMITYREGGIHEPKA